MHTGSVQPPAAPRRPSRREVHGDVVDDPYAWMRDKSDPELIAYLEAENAYTDAVTADQADLARAIYDDIDARTQQTDLSVPDFVRHSDGRCYWYYARTEKGLDYASFHRVPATDRDQLPDPNAQPGSIAGEELLLDANLLAAGQDFFALGAFEVSPDGNLLAYAVDTTGDERYSCHFLDLRTSQPLPDVLPEIAAGGCWAGDDTFCYLTMDAAWRPDTVHRHLLGEDGDTVVFHEPDERFWLGVGESRDRRWVLISAGSKTSSETLLLAAGDRTGGPRVVTRRRPGIEYDVEVASDRLYIVHNDQADDFALAQAPLDASSAADWQPLWPGKPGIRLLGVSAYDQALVVSLRRDGLARVVVHPLTDSGDPGPGHEIDFGEPLFHVDADGSEDADTDRIRLSYQSMVTPEQVLEYRLDTGERRVLKQRPVLDHPVLGPYRPEDYVQRREWATAADGTRIPISLIHRADTPLDGSAGCVLYGYGAYEISIAPTFSIARLSLLDRGYVYAIAHVRGGGELGRAWYYDGRLEAKEHSFTDFVACARHLVSAGYTCPDRLAAEGGSAGGLLLGAALNLAPEVFAAAHAAVPFVDALNTILDPELPLTVVEWEEWGDPVHDAAAYHRMKGYTPYENLRPVRYPAILVTTSLNDTRVEVTEPAKWVARLRYDTGATANLALRTELVAGHGGASGRYAGWRDTAFELAWLIWNTPPSGDVAETAPSRT
ncbi:MAG: S9 family peptidase [Propionicimonas sp.]|uniref:S9 family peptidase n=1 Tax=Propionicimonas sp. TaxID=1955623 RepID=UPI002B1F5435|nr:S9 family peptidase [Propionicimonas sp.]MEA4943675.1 S9 family peptidase [Propionicimonas sp.]